MFRVVAVPVSLAHPARMPIHLEKGITLALALLGPVVTTVFFHWRALATARRQQHPE